MSKKIYLFALMKLLRQFEREDFAHMPENVQGHWSRRNLEAMMRDIATEFRRA